MTQGKDVENHVKSYDTIEIIQDQCESIWFWGAYRPPIIVNLNKVRAMTGIQEGLVLPNPCEGPGPGAAHTQTYTHAHAHGQDTCTHTCTHTNTHAQTQTHILTQTHTITTHHHNTHHHAL